MGIPWPGKTAGTGLKGWPLKGWPPLAAVGVLAVAAVGMAQTSFGHSVLGDAGLYQQPQPYTALAFTNPQSLPQQISSAPQAIRMSFTIGNASADTRVYRWSVTVQSSAQSRSVAAGKVRVGHHSQAKVATEVTASCSGGQATVRVKLVSPAESIDFQAACSP